MTSKDESYKLRTRMPRMVDRDSSSADMSRESTVVGSEDGFRMRLPRGDSDYDASETTGLLDAGTPAENEPTKDAWNGLADFEGLPWWRRPSVYWLIVPYSLFTLAFGGVMVPKLNLIISLICGRYFSDRAATDPTFNWSPSIFDSDDRECLSPAVQRRVATFSLAISVIGGTLSAFTAPRLGALSDRYGRKRIMVITSSGGLLGEIITILAAKFPDKIHYNWLILSAFVDGLAGSFTAGSVLSHSYTTDCTPPSKRAVAIGYMHACLAVGMAFGPLFGGYFVELTGSLVSIFYLTLGCHVVFILYILLVLPESVSRRRQMLAREKHSKEQAEGRVHDEAVYGRGPSDSWVVVVKMFFSGVRGSNPLAPLKILVPPGQRLAKVRRNLIFLAVMDTVLLSAVMSSGGVTLLYTEYMFGWRNFETSAFMSLLSMVRVIVLMVIFPIINYVFRTRPAQRQRRESGIAPVEKNTGADKVDMWLIRTAVLSDILGVAGYIFVRTPALFVTCGVITAFGGLGMATIQSSLTKHVPAERVGSLLGAVGLLHAISRVFAPVIFNGLYAATVGSFPQAIYCLVTATFTSVLIMSLFVRPHVYMAESDEPPSPTTPAQRGQSELTEEDMVPQI